MNKCLGGIMVWAISQDTKDAKYSEALRIIASRPSKRAMQDGTASALSTHPQCKWTNCGECKLSRNGSCLYRGPANCGYIACPSGLVTVPRLDGNARDGEIMVDDQGCEGHGSHILCCPPDKGIPPCGWYGHRNGDCTGACPTEMIEIGSNNMFCNNAIFGSLSKGYQAACCSPVEGIGSHRVRFESLEMQNQCSLGSWPACNGECDSSARPDLLFSSFDGGQLYLYYIDSPA